MPTSGRQSARARSWCETIVSDSAYLFGAICPARGVGGCHHHAGGQRRGGSNEHLAEISTQIMPGAHAVLLCDGAGWHQTGDKLRVPENISLLPIPPYSPELNPMENVWAYPAQQQALRVDLEQLRRDRQCVQGSLVLLDQRSKTHSVNRSLRVDVRSNL